MELTELIGTIEKFKPLNEQEKVDQAFILHELKTNPFVFLRSSLAVHVSASAWVVNETRDKVLMIYHNIYDTWVWLGGHADGDPDLLQVALKEVQEESGLTKIRPVITDIFSLEVLTVDGHEKNGHYVSSHLHLNVTYLIEADEEEEVQIKPDENSGVAWFPLEEALVVSSEEWFKKRIYPKMKIKLNELKEEKKG